ncbi:MAG: hypothetical protein PUP93_10705 [Rhizonema sp. NSF051]|nr:hypothetical protein [Rhizonema sp. NSF051]
MNQCLGEPVRMTLFPAFADWWNAPVGASPDHLVRSGIVFSLGET